MWPFSKKKKPEDQEAKPDDSVSSSVSISDHVAVREEGSYDHEIANAVERLQRRNYQALQHLKVIETYMERLNDPSNGPARTAALNAVIEERKARVEALGIKCATNLNAVMKQIKELGGD